MLSAPNRTIALWSWRVGTLPNKQNINEVVTEPEAKRVDKPTSSSPDNRNKAVVAYLDGRRLKGYIYNFSAQKDRFRLFFEQDVQQREGTDVQMKDLKAIFFARDFVGNSEYTETQTLTDRHQGRKAEVS